MTTETRLRVAVLIAVLAIGTSLARAEVSAEVTSTGEYWRTVVRGNASVKNLKIWAPASPRDRLFPLNPEGDANGDLWPTVAENPFDGNRPWVLWSRWNGADFDLGWSRWTSAGWSEVAWLDGGGPGDDLDPSIGFTPGTGRANTAWWEAAPDGTGRVWLSVFLSTRWMSPVLISDPAVDSRSPAIAVRDDGTIEISFDTPSGPVTRVVKLLLPATITDDLDPLGALTVDGAAPTHPEVDRYSR